MPTAPTSILYAIGGFANAVRRIFLDIALIDSIGEHPTKKPDRSCSGAKPTFHNRFAAFELRRSLACTNIIEKPDP
jgi:hypothetical protein